MNTLSKKFFTRIVKINFKDLADIHRTKSFNLLHSDINDAYGEQGLGAIIIKDVPEHFQTKYKLLSQTKKLAGLSQDALRRVEKPDLNYSYGWSHGKEKFNGNPDVMKGSYYADLPVYSGANSSIEGEQSEHNVWPKEIPELETDFLALGNQVREVSMMLQDCIDSHIKSLIPSYSICFKDLMKISPNSKGRLLHYFPRGDMKITPDDKWNGWHNDHGALTGLVSALYFDQQGEIMNEKIRLEKTGLWIQARNGEFHKVTYGKNDIAYQIGETFQILSGGVLHATPHSVTIEDDIPKDVHRSTFALFMAPEKNYLMTLPQGAKKEDIVTSDIYPVPKIQDRFVKNEMTVGEFDERTMNAFNVDQL